MCTLLRETSRVARKPHTCIWCGQPIQKSEKYLDIRMVNDEAYCVETQRWHPECNDAMLEECRLDGGGCFYFSPYEAPRPEPLKLVV